MDSRCLISELTFSRLMSRNRLESRVQALSSILISQGSSPSMMGALPLTPHRRWFFRMSTERSRDRSGVLPRSTRTCQHTHNFYYLSASCAMFTRALHLLCDLGVFNCSALNRFNFGRPGAAESDGRKKSRVWWRLETLMTVLEREWVEWN